MNRRSNKGRDITGIILLDKPPKQSSNAALQRVKRSFQARKAGHTGSLDPLATGMLPICLGEATKFSQFLLNADKHYAVSAKLGIATTTGDAEGDIVSQHEVPELTEQSLEAILQSFRGEISQVPSMYSALKHQGKPLYELARQGKTVERKARNIHIYQLTVKNIGRDTLDLIVHCSKGTYIRTLVEDIGKALGCGAHVSHLRRTQIGSMVAPQMVSLDTIEELGKANKLAELDQLMIGLEQALPTDWPSINLSNAACFYLRRGQAIRIPRLPDNANGHIILYQDKKFLGIGYVAEDGRVAPRRLISSPLIMTRKSEKILLANEG